MLRPHVKIEGGRYPASWALGWQIFHNQARNSIYHGGDNRGFHCFAVASVEGRSGLIVMTNGDHAQRGTPAPPDGRFPGLLRALA
jgi:Beta-lactamase